MKRDYSELGKNLGKTWLVDGDVKRDYLELGKNLGETWLVDGDVS